MLVIGDRWRATSTCPGKNLGHYQGAHFAVRPAIFLRYLRSVAVFESYRASRQEESAPSLMAPNSFPDMNSSLKWMMNRRDFSAAFSQGS